MKHLLLTLPILGLLSAQACGADPLYFEETDLVVTAADDGRNYSSFKTYVLVDEVGDLCLQPTSGSPDPDAYGGEGGVSSLDPDNCEPNDHSSDEAILDAIADNMEKLGYERMEESESGSADAIVLAALISRRTWSLHRSYCYPESFYPGCVDPLSEEPVEFLNGSLLLQLIDRKKSSGDELVTSWTAAIDQYWAVTATAGSDAAETVFTRAIDRAFDQSPYLRGEQ